MSLQPQAVDLGGGREAWTGFYTSIRLGQWKPLVNFDMSTTAFYKAMNVMEFAREMFGDRCLHAGLSDRDRITLQKELFGLRVTHTHLNPNRTHRIDKLSMRGANQERFECNGRQVTVAEYFAQKYKIRLQYPQLQCIVERKGAMMPMELCVLAPGQHCRKKLSEIQTSKLIRSTATDPRSRFQRVAQAAQSTQRAAKTYLDEFEMKIESQPVRIASRHNAVLLYFILFLQRFSPRPGRSERTRPAAAPHHEQFQRSAVHSSRRLLDE